MIFGVHWIDFGILIRKRPLSSKVAEGAKISTALKFRPAAMRQESAKSCQNIKGPPSACDASDIVILDFIIRKNRIPSPADIPNR